MSYDDELSIARAEVQALRAENERLRWVLRSLNDMLDKYGIAKRMIEAALADTKETKT